MNATCQLKKVYNIDDCKKNIGWLKEYMLYDSIYMKSRTDEIILW